MMPLRYEVLVHHLAILQGSADLDRQRRVLDEMEELQHDHTLDGVASHYVRMKALLGLSNRFVWSAFHRYRALLELQSANISGFDRAVARAEEAGHGQATRQLPGTRADVEGSP